MNKKSFYAYNQGDLDNPIKYQMTPFEGFDFLISYLDSRKLIRDSLTSKIKIIDINDVCNFLSKNYYFDSAKKAKPVKTIQTLANILYDIKNNSSIPKTKMIFEIFIKKFEVTKKIFSSYSHDFKQTSQSYSNLENYVILSLICLLNYETSHNLRYLNTSLKLNDIICSQTNNIVDPILIALFKFVIEKEINIVTTLSKSKGIAI